MPVMKLSKADLAKKGLQELEKGAELTCSETLSGTVLILCSQPYFDWEASLDDEDIPTGVLVDYP